LKNLRRKFERFCFVHRNKGIPNLMLYVSLGSALVYLISMISGNTILYDMLCFDRNLILQGQVWRLISFPLAYSGSGSNFLLVAISLICYYSLGRAMENVWGTFRFNLFYLSGVLMMDLFAMCLGGITVASGNMIYSFDGIYRSMGYYLNLSLFLGYATLYPNAHFLLFFIIPVKAWIFALLDLVLTFVDVFQMSVPVFCFPHNLFPLVALANYFLFFGKDVLNVIPMSWRVNARRVFKKKNTSKTTAKTGTIVFPNAGSYQATTATVKAPYTHKCTVCGRTDVSNPELEFRYCSRCNGYHCYCEDHISNHTHVE
jgi:membrane associated rhomboid family serine protease